MDKRDWLLKAERLKGSPLNIGDKLLTKKGEYNIGPKDLELLNEIRQRESIESPEKAVEEVV